MHSGAAPAVAIGIAIVVNLAFALFPFRIGHRGPRIGIWFSGPASIVLLWGIGVLGTRSLAAGLLGTRALVPWQIIVIFFSTAYVSVSADNTGLFDLAAHRIVRGARGNGRRLFVSIYLFSLVLTLFTSNDIVILTLTPIIFYLGRHAEVDVVPLLFTEFIAANTSSMLLYIGNPTNIIIGNALGIGFWRFSLTMLVPSVVASVGYLVGLFLVFRSRIPKVYSISPESEVYVRSPGEAVAALATLLIMLAVLGVSQYSRLPIWMITAGAALFTVVKDLFYEIITPVERRGSRLWLAARKMPWMILPFVVVFFWLVQGLADSGAVDILAATAARASRSPLEASLVLGGASAVVANLMNNQPMSILFAHLLINPAFRVAPDTFEAAAFAVVTSSNLGANLTLVGALAGLMWKRILADKEVRIGYVDFLKVGLKTTPAVLLVALVALGVGVSAGLR